MQVAYTEKNAFKSPNNHKWAFKTEVIINFLTTLKDEEYPLKFEEYKDTFYKEDLEEMLRANKLNLEKWDKTPQFKDSKIIMNKLKLINEYFKTKI